MARKLDFYVVLYKTIFYIFDEGLLFLKSSISNSKYLTICSYICKMFDFLIQQTAMSTCLNSKYSAIDQERYKVKKINK